ncbi:MULTISPECIES: SMI1/KNR4 family protein [unclassified Nocardia]|uniref:SMI1/KNR4 family protein n=1 Tax=unclassified Nocardia TaxID=2637762 RepID=UPI0024A8A2DF|nr:MULTISPECIES: SMI1/KNR4 family protein [unclassified Nocardia]
MWKELIGQLYPWAEFGAPASDAEIDQIEERLGYPVPDELRDLLRQANGVETGDDLVWPIQQIITDNLEFRSNADFAELYKRFDHLMFIGSNGGGDQFAYLRGSEGWADGIYVWDHETDERESVSGSLSNYVRWRSGAEGDSRYR